MRKLSKDVDMESVYYKVLVPTADVKMKLQNVLCEVEYINAALQLPENRITKNSKITLKQQFDTIREQINRANKALNGISETTLTDLLEFSFIVEKLGELKKEQAEKANRDKDNVENID